MSYEVGQVVYLLNNESLTIVPALIIEEIVRKTLTDQTKQHVIKLPGEDNNNVILESLNEHVYSDVDALRNHMLDNTKKSINKLIQNAIEKKDLFFSEKSKSTSKIEMDVKEPNKDKKFVQNDIKQVIMNNKDTINKNDKEEK